MAQHILITGVSRGLGRAMTEEFISLGHTIWGCARQAEPVTALQNHYGPPHDFAVVDVANQDQVKAWGQSLLERHGPPDILINNAGVINALAPLWQVPPAEFDRVIDVNIKGVANVLRQFVPAMVQRGRGIIVNLSSGWGRSTSPQVAPYCTSKWAIEGMTRALAQELPATMAAVPLNPGIIHTDMLEVCYGDEAASFTALQQWKKQVVPFILQLSPKDNGRPLTVPGG
ncbi:3-oxoacyl-[acyl-carrier-protein] reductase [Halomicronema hongdechloris C2206]|uniref:3-oxoacyl-[acyl-carrier-protein] reductase n=1 Tax=Halomicronema hongdechloris C2206 TaxID=1641165 RepID=A0A1Z3HLR9_9CYAN|nr:SDR family NAD(P)-dependent oxidoreductase [Halomicronema hongdechloris]ASC71225.1 3-oxoacyl-[acyl-carrier-protein] reductase [Halomicronema hongdechloris C2206]